MDILETIVNIGNQYVWSTPSVLPWLVALLLGAGFFVTARLALIQLRQLRHAIRVVMGKYDDPNDPGDVSHFQALSTALSATVGIGNIAGVATAIHYGGPGAVFWMWVTAIFGMALKFAECTLSMRYRDFDDRGNAAGGPMYYIEKGLGPAWKPLAIFFAGCAIIASFGGGNMNQANTVAVSAVAEWPGLSPNWVGGILFLIVGAVILGGIKSIAKVASALAPSMAVLYVSGALVVLAIHISDVPAAFVTIVSDAFNPKASLGGSVAGVFSLTLLWGVKRGLFSNEAGQGSAPIAHAAARTDEPVREGAVAMLGPLIDTLVICSMTALVIVVTGVWDEKKDSLVPLAQIESVAVGESVPSQDEIPVRHGVADATFYVSGGVAEEALVVDADGIAFTGTLVYVDGVGSALTGKADTELELSLSGKMLQNSSALTSWGFQRGLAPLGDWGGWIVTICVFLFAVSTMVSWSYYGDRCVVYLFGSKYVIVYRLVFITAVYIGATTALEVVWAYGDLALGLMTVPNLIAVILLLPKVVEMTKDYFERMKEVDANVVPAAAVVDKKESKDG